MAQQQQQQQQQETDEAFYRKPLYFNRDKVLKQKLTAYQVKKLLILIGKLKPIIRTNADSEVEYDLQIKSKGNGYENINLRNRWTTRPQAMRDLFERTFWYKEPHQKLSDYIEKLK